MSLTCFDVTQILYITIMYLYMLPSVQKVSGIVK